MAQGNEHLGRARERMYPRSIRARVTAGAVTAFALFMCAILVISAFLIRELVREQHFNRVDEAALQMVEHVNTQRYEDAIPTPGPVVCMQVVDRDSGQVLAATAVMDGLPPITDEAPPGEDIRMSETVCGAPSLGDERDCFLVVGYAVDESAYGDVTVLAAARSPDFLTTYALELVLIGAAAVLTLGTGLVIWYGVGRALSPVRRISSEMEQITANDLHRRVPAPRTDDEIAELAGSANETLARLEDAVTRQRRFVSDASHELRNPITGMRTKLEVELSDPDPDLLTREHLLTGLLSDTERLENIVVDLLELARVETGGPGEYERVDLAELVEAEFSDHRDYPNLYAHTCGPVTVNVNRLRIVRVLTNLIANAERHCDGRIDLYVGRADHSALVEVHDDGSGIAEKDRERIFERFARLAESESRDPGGSGLGLPISREVVQAHGGTLVAGHSELLGGALFTLRLPLAPDQDRA